MSESFNNTDLQSAQSSNCTPVTPSARPEFKVQPNETGITISVDLPGVPSDQLSVTTEKQQIKIKATRHSHTPSEWNLLNQVEQPASYSLKLNVHQDMDLTKIKAKFVNGVLHLLLTKRAESLPRNIEIDSEN